MALHNLCRFPEACQIDDAIPALEKLKVFFQLLNLMSGKLNN